MKALAAGDFWTAPDLAGRVAEATREYDAMEGRGELSDDSDDADERDADGHLEQSGEEDGQRDDERDEVEEEHPWTRAEEPDDDPEAAALVRRLHGGEARFEAWRPTDAVERAVQRAVVRAESSIRP